MKVVINTEYGGFHLSKDQVDIYRKLSGRCDDEISAWNMNRTDPYLIQIVEGLQYEGSLEVVEIPDGMHYFINEYDGMESIIWSKSKLHFVR